MFVFKMSKELLSMMFLEILHLNLQITYSFLIGCLSLSFILNDCLDDMSLNVWPTTIPAGL